MNRRRFIKTGLIFVPTWFHAGLSGSIQLSHLDPGTYAWMGQVVTNGGNYTSLSVVAGDTWLKLISSAGLRSLFYRANLFIGADLTACRVPILRTVGVTLDGIVGFIAGDYSESTGLTGDGLTKYSNLGVNIDSFPSIDDFGYGCYVRSNFREASVQLGCNLTTDADRWVYLVVRYSDGSTIVQCCGSALNRVVVTDDTSAIGLYQVSRTASNSLKLYKNGAQFGTTATTPGGSLPNVDFGTHAIISNVTTSQYSTKTLAGKFICKGMTDSQAAAHYYAWQRMQTILGRQV